MGDTAAGRAPDGGAFDVTWQERTVAYRDESGREIALRGALWVPAREGRCPAVILSHGFNGHFTDFPLECRRLAARGFVCFAFDFCGAQSGGRSTGRTWRDYTLFTMKEDLRAAIGYVRGLDVADPGRLFLFGGSQGGLVTALTAADRDMKDRIAAIAMYFPAMNIPSDWRASPVRDTPLMGWHVSAGYIRSMRELDPFRIIGGYGGDVCVIWGDRDRVVSRETIQRTVEAYGADRVSLTVLPGAGHGFGGEALESAVARLAGFLEARA